MTAQEQTFGAKIRMLREESGRSMQKLADALGVSVVYISDIERGRRNPPLGEKLWKIADFLGLPRQEVETWAHKSRARVELDLKAKEEPVAEAALLLAKRWDDITAQEANDILKILKRKKYHDRSYSSAITDEGERDC